MTRQVSYRDEVVTVDALERLAREHGRPLNAEIGAAVRAWLNPLTKDHAALIGGIVGGVLDNAHDMPDWPAFWSEVYETTEEEVLEALREMEEVAR